MIARFLPLASTTAILACLSTNLFLIPVVAPVAARELGLNPVWVGAITTVAFGVAVLSSLASGGAVRRWGAVTVGQLCLLASAVAALLMASAELSLMLLAAVVFGLGFGPETPAASHLLARETPPSRRPLIFSLKQCGIQLGGVIAGLLIPAFVVIGSWRLALLLVAFISVALAVALLPLRRRYDSDRDPAVALHLPAVGASIQLVWAAPELRRLALAAFAFSALQQCLNTYLVVYLVEGLGLSLAVAGLILAGVQVAGICGRIGWGLIADRWIPTRILLAGLGAAMSGAAVLLALAATSWPFAVLMVVCCFFGASATGWNGIFLAEVARLAPVGRACDVTGGMLAAAYCGLMAGPTIFGVLAGSGAPLQTGYIFWAISSAIGTSILLLPVRLTAAAQLAP